MHFTFQSQEYPVTLVVKGSFTRPQSGVHQWKLHAFDAVVSKKIAARKKLRS